MRGLGLSGPAQTAVERRAKASPVSSPSAIAKSEHELRFVESEKMPVRMTSKTVTFKRPFIIGGFDQLQPAGTYTVDTEEEQLDAVSHPVWKRLATVIAINNAGATEYRRIDPDELQEALMRDGQEEDPNEPSATSPDVQRDRAQLTRRKRY